MGVCLYLRLSVFKFVLSSVSAPVRLKVQSTNGRWCDVYSSFTIGNTCSRSAYLLLLAGRSLWSTAAAGRPPGPSMPLSTFPKSRRTKAEGEVPRPKILGDDPAAGGVLEQSWAARTTSAMRCLCRFASKRSSYATFNSCIITLSGPLLVFPCTTASFTASAVTPRIGS
jgi:hypothetical protein